MRGVRCVSPALAVRDRVRALERGQRPPPADRVQPAAGAEFHTAMRRSCRAAPSAAPHCSPGVATGPAGTASRPIELLGRSLRLTDRGRVVVGPLRCAKPSKARCRGRLELRLNGRATVFGTRRFSLRAGRTAIRLGNRTQRELRRKSSNGRITLIVRLNRPKAFVRSYPPMRIVPHRAASASSGSARTAAARRVDEPVGAHPASVPITCES
jgi:hypothetical protein